MMLARCPACRTVFRVRPEQLRAHHGEVRCGRCQGAFNALEHLLDEPSRTPAGSAPESEQAAPVVAPARKTDDFFVLEEKRPEVPPGRPLHFGAADSGTAPRPGAGPEDELRVDLAATGRDPGFDRLDFEIPEGPPAPRRPLRTSDLLRREPLIGPAVEPSVAPDVTALPDVVDLPEPDPGETADKATGPHEQVAEPARQPPGEFDRAKDDTPDDAPMPEPDPTETAPEAAETGAVDDEQARVARGDPAAATADGGETERLDRVYGVPPGMATRRGAAGLALGILLGALAVQAAYLFREPITRAWPQLRPAYLAACERLRCTVPLPRVVEQIGIETSDLKADPRGPGQFVLHATVRNRAPFPQAYPNLELTLTDARDQPVVRRVLAPAEWVPPRQLERADDGFAPRAEVALRLPFDAPGVPAAGYRLYIFYP